MKSRNGLRMVVLGCGNVGWHVAAHFRKKGLHVNVHNHRGNSNLEGLRDLGCSVNATLDNIPPNARAYFVCVSDEQIAAAAAHIQVANPAAVIVHMSGSMPLSALGNRVVATGVIYPVQTFSAADSIEWEGIPLVLQCSRANRAAIDAIAGLFSSVRFYATEKERMRIHLAAVFANNFSNALYAAALRVLPPSRRDMAILMPLIRQGVKKLERMPPLDAQTGPARRNDRAVVKRHMAALEADDDLRRIYKHMTRLIRHQAAK